MKIEICNIKEVKDVVKETEDVTSVISITNTTRVPLSFPDDLFQIHFSFDDQESEEQPFHPTKEHVLLLIEAGQDILKMEGTCVIHCHGGTCRSTAAAFVLMCMEMGEGKEKEAASRLMLNHETAIPNMLIIDHADRILGRDGKMVKAMREWDGEMNARVFRWTQ